MIITILLCVCVFSTEGSLIHLPKVNQDARIIGGQPASYAQFPWQVAIYKNTPLGNYFCGGAIISDIWILTAAQCVYEATFLTVQLGSNQLLGTDPHHVTFNSTTYFYEPRFDPETLAHDIGVIKLNSSIRYTDYIRPIVLTHLYYLYPARRVTVSGWGQTGDADPYLSNYLNYVDLIILDQSVCHAYYGSALLDTMVCAVGNPVNNGICYGDIGGVMVTPAFEWLGNFSVAVAISSWMSANGCESSDPTGYTRINPYLNWIANVTSVN